MISIAARPATGPAPEGGAPDRRARSAGDAPGGGFAEALGAATAADGDRDHVGVGGDGADASSAGPLPETSVPEGAPSSAELPLITLPVAPLDTWSSWLHWTAAQAHDDTGTGSEAEGQTAIAAERHTVIAAEPAGDASGTPVLDGAVTSTAPLVASHGPADPAATATTTTTTPAPAPGIPASGHQQATVQGLPVATPPPDTSGQAAHTDTAGQPPTAWDALAPPVDVPADLSPQVVKAPRELGGHAARQPENAAPVVMAGVPHGHDADVTLESLMTPTHSGGPAETVMQEGAQGMHRTDPAAATRVESAAPAPLHTPLAVPSMGAARPPDAFDAMPSVDAAHAADTATSVVDQVVKSLRVQWKQGIGEARIQLRPEHLGPVDISIRVEGGAVTAVVRAESTQVQEWIVGNQQSLRQQLEDAGLRLADLVISPDAERRHKRGDQHQDDARPPSRRRRAGEAEPIFEVVV